jgi:8-oxo-dGTP pyrophosphatase MutT (NUDIX family)
MAVNGVVRAAGGVISRRSRRGELEVLIIHRKARGDWSFPKGKAEPGESDEDCALREVEEETGLRCALGAELPSVSYRDRKDRPKRVRYWAMTVVRGSARPQNEIDAVRWVTVAEAIRQLTYPRDRDVLAAFADSGSIATP